MSQPGTRAAACAGRGLEAFEPSTASLSPSKRREITIRAIARLLRMDGDELVADVLIDDEKKGGLA